MFTQSIFACAFAIACCIAWAAKAEIIHVHAKRGNLKGVLAELDKGVPLEIRSTSMTSEPGVTPLFVAAKFGKVEVVKELLARGADPTIFFTAPDGRYSPGTALHHAARFGYLDVVELLLDAGADPASYDQYASTPLHQALRGEHVSVAARLIAAGAPERVLAPSIADLFSEADLELGKEIARGCEFCHGAPTDDRAMGDNGPSLWGIFNQPAASDPEYAYSTYLREADLIWDMETLNHFLHSPYQFLPGTSKLMFGIEDNADRAALNAYLATLAD